MLVTLGVFLAFAFFGARSPEEGLLTLEPKFLQVALRGNPWGRPLNVENLRPFRF